ncbi:MAG: polysaccharide biosynthesis C-terminal domain-containing protein [Candidatus Brocadiia bacterium]
MVDNEEITQGGISHVRELGKDLLGYLPSKIVPLITSFVATAIITRMIKPDDYGLLTLVTATVTFAGTLGFDWIGYSVWRYYDQYKQNDELSLFMGTIINLNILMAGIVGAIIYGMALFYSNDVSFSQLLKIAILLLVTGRIYTFIIFIFQLQRKPFKYSLYSSIVAVLNVVFIGIFLYYFSARVDNIIYAAVIANGIVSIPGIIDLYRKLSVKWSSFSGRIVKQVVLFGLPQLGTLLGAVLLSLSDRFMINYYSSTADVGIYSAGYKVAEFCLNYAYNFLLLAVMPIIIQTYVKHGEKLVSDKLKMFIGVYLMILIPAAFGTIAVGQDIVKIMMGIEYHGSYIVLPWVVGGVFFFGLSQYFTLPLQLKERPSIIAILISGAGVLNILLNMVMIPRWGIIGAAAATLIAYFAYAVTSYWINNKVIRIRIPLDTLIKSLISAVVMYLSVDFGVSKFINLGLIPGLIIKIIWGAIIYFAVLYILREPIISKLAFIRGKSSE